MTVSTWRHSRRHLALPLVAGLMVCAAAVSAQPPSAQSRATTAASNVYQACLAHQLARLPAATTRQAVSIASGACGRQEAVVSAALLKENPDRPLFAQSYVETLKDLAVSRVPSTPVLPLTVAQRTGP